MTPSSGDFSWTLTHSHSLAAIAGRYQIPLTQGGIIDLVGSTTTDGVSKTCRTERAVTSNTAIALPAIDFSDEGQSQVSIQGTNRADTLRGTPRNDGLQRLGGNDIPTLKGWPNARWR